MSDTGTSKGWGLRWLLPENSTGAKTMGDIRLIVGEHIKELTPELIAAMFCDLGSDEQARFFNHIDKVASTWTAPFSFQLQEITDDDGLTLAGRRVMQEIGNYSHWGLCDWKANRSQDNE